jgi:hypothetical protein
MSAPTSQWVCKKCTTNNSVRLRKCETCNFPRKISTKASGDDFISQRIRELKKIHDIDDQPDMYQQYSSDSSSDNLSTEEELSWQCDSCTYKNTGLHDDCLMCSLPREIQPVPQDYISPPELQEIPLDTDPKFNAIPNSWKCPNCTYSNTPLLDTCEICDTSKEPSSNSASGVRDPIPGYTDTLIGGVENNPLNGISAGTVLNDAINSVYKNNPTDNAFVEEIKEPELEVELEVEPVVELSEQTKMLRDLAIERRNRKDNSK